MSEDGILLSIVNKDNGRDVICVAHEKAFQGKVNLPKFSGDSLIQLRNFSGCLIFELTKRYLESALSRLNSSCPTNLRIERSAISPLLEPTSQVVDENNSTKTDDDDDDDNDDDDDEIDDDGDSGDGKTDPYHGLQEEPSKVISRCDHKLQLPSGNSRHGSQIMTGSEKVESVVNVDCHKIRSGEGNFRLVVSPVNKMLSTTPYPFVLFPNQSVQQSDSIAVQPISLMAHIDNNTIEACSSGCPGSDPKPEEGTRCVMDIAADLLADMKDGEDKDYFTEKVSSTGIHNMSENEEVSMHRESISGDVHDQPSWNVSFCSSDLPGQGHVILRSNKNDPLPEASSSSFGHLRANKTVSSVNPISLDSANIPSVTGLSNKLVGDGLSVGEKCVETETGSERFSCGSGIDTVNDIVGTDVTTEMCFSTPESNSNSKDSHMTIEAEEAFGKDRHCRMKMSVEMNVKPSCERSVTVDTGDKPELGPATDVFITREEVTAQLLLISLPIDELLHRVRHDHFSYIKASKIKPRLSLSSEKTEWKREAWLKCYPCRIFHRTPQKLLKHIKNKHLTRGPVVCEVCKKEMKTPRVFQEHQLKHSSIKPYACRICKKRFTTPATLDGHKKSHRKIFTCVTCGLVLNNFVDMIKHRLTHRRDQNVGNDPLSCGVCGKRLANRLTFEAHMRGHRGEKPYACSICNKAFTYQLYMKRHERSHAPDYKQYSCKQCKKAFLYQCDLRKHERFHTGEKPYSCQTCGKSFVLPYQLKRHAGNHTTGKPFACDVCKKSFALPSYLKSHKLIHTVEKTFMCARCGKRFASKQSLGRHEAIHSDAIPYMCNQCGQAFRLRQHLIDHQNVHFGEKTHSDQDNRVHLSVSRGKRNCKRKGIFPSDRCEDTVSGENPQPPPSFQDAVSLPETPWTCDTCGQTFRSKSALTRHIRTHANS